MAGDGTVSRLLSDRVTGGMKTFWQFNVEPSKAVTYILVGVKDPAPFPTLILHHIPKDQPGLCPFCSASSLKTSPLGEPPSAFDLALVFAKHAQNVSCASGISTGPREHLRKTAQPGQREEKTCAHTFKETSEHQ